MFPYTESSFLLMRKTDIGRPLVSMIVFWTIAKSAVFPIIVVSNKRNPEFMDGNLLKLEYKSNILTH